MRLVSLAVLLASSALFAGEPKTDAERLNGTWVFDGYQMTRSSGLGQVWTSVVTVADGKFSITKVYGSDKAFTGSFTLDEGKKAIDFKVDGFDLSSVGSPVKLSPCTIPALYKLDGDTLTLALELNTEGKRPAAFKAVNKRDVVLTLKRATKDFKAFPAELKVTVVGPDGKPAGAEPSAAGSRTLRRDRMPKPRHSGVLVIATVAGRARSTPPTAAPAPG